MQKLILKFQHFKNSKTTPADNECIVEFTPPDNEGMAVISSITFRDNVRRMSILQFTDLQNQITRAAEEIQVQNSASNELTVGDFGKALFKPGGLNGIVDQLKNKVRSNKGALTDDDVKTAESAFSLIDKLLGK